MSKKSGGPIRINLKAFTPAIYTALTDSRDEVVLSTFRRLVTIGRERVDEFLVASILFDPGFVDAYEIRKLGEFIAYCNLKIPTIFLGFVPQHHMRDLPPTSSKSRFVQKKLPSKQVSTMYASVT